VATTDAKTKLTISIRKSVIESGKEYASRRGTSFSQLIEDLVEKTVRGGEPDFVEQWGGKFVLRRRAGDPRFEYLKRKYGL